MDKRYLNYRAIDFVKDSQFLQWRLFLQKEDEILWEKFIEKYPHKEREILRAIEIIDSVRVNDYKLSQSEKDVLLLGINEMYKLRVKKKKTNIYWSAACVSVLLVFAYWLNSFYMDTEKMFSSDNNIGYSDTLIQLITADSKILTFDKNVKIQYDEYGNLTSESKPISIAQINSREKDGLNKLIVPKGKRSFLVLEDSSQIWINSGTTIEFPTKFANHRREITVKGEIFIEVKRNEKAPFYINTLNYSVNVLGTKFDLSAYEENGGDYVVLVEGSVGVCSGNVKTILHPNQIVNVDRHIHTVNDINVYDYISWKDGLLQFRSRPLSEILASLSRYYNVKICAVGEVGYMKCTGKLILFDDVDKVLFTLSNTVPIEYIKTDIIKIFGKD